MMWISQCCTDGTDGGELLQFALVPGQDYIVSNLFTEVIYGIFVNSSFLNATEGEFACTSRTSNSNYRLRNKNL